MKRSIYFKIMVIIIFSLFIVLNAFAKGPRSKPFLPDIPQTWTKITPRLPVAYMKRDLQPQCSGFPGTNSEFSFFVKGGSINNVVVFFDGGGACWHTNNCIYIRTYNLTVDETVEGLTAARGIFETDNPSNPFRDWNFVFIPYCTGDLHWGSNDNQYQDHLNLSGGAITIHHRGFDNFLVVLKWINENFRRPNEIFVTGSSAGSYGAMLAFPYIQEAYPKSKTSILGDAGFGVVTEDFHNNIINNWGFQQNLPAWIPGFEKPFSEYSNAEMYKMIAAYYPNRKIGQYTTAWDRIQALFYNVMININNPENWDKFLPVWCDWHRQMIEYADLAAQAPNYRYYIGAGTDHTIIWDDKFYEENSAGIPFVDWVKVMVGNQGGTRGHGGIPWENVECVDCAAPVICP
jgi:hypothetical protein